MNCKLTNTAYKLLSQDLRSYGGTEWKIGVPVAVTVPGKTLCTTQLLHCYSDPELAVILNPIHANILNPRLFEIKTSEIIADDGLKQGCKKQVLVKELPIPVISTNVRIAFAILCAINTPQNNTFIDWAYNWLNKKNRSKEAAAAVAAAAYIAAYAADIAAAAVASDAAYAAVAVVGINKNTNLLTLLQKAKQYE